MTNFASFAWNALKSSGRFVAALPRHDDDFDDDLFPPLPLEEGTELPSSLCFSAKQIVVLVGAAIHKRKKIWRKPIEILIFFSSSYTFVFASSSRLLLWYYNVKSCRCSVLKARCVTVFLFLTPFLSLSAVRQRRLLRTTRCLVRVLLPFASI